MVHTGQRAGLARGALGAIVAALLALGVMATPAAAEATLTEATVRAETGTTGPESAECDKPLTVTESCSASSSGEDDDATGSASGAVVAELGFDGQLHLTSIATLGNSEGTAASKRW